MLGQIQRHPADNLVVVGDFRVEEAARQGLLDVWLELIPCGSKGDVGLVVHATTTGNHGDDTAFSVKDGGARVTFVGEGAAPTVGHNCGLEGGKLEVTVVVITDKGFEFVYLVDGSASGQAVLNNGHRLVAAGIELCGLVNLALGHDTAVFLLMYHCCSP